MWSPALTAMDRAHTSIEFNIILSPTGELVTLQRLSEKAQAFAVPSTPEAESRSSDIRPFPLAGSLKYLMPKKQNGKLDSYLAKLKAWCAEPHAPQCLCVLLAWLQKKTLYAGLPNVVGLKLEYDKGDTPGKSKDADKTVCFSVECPGEENRLWMREDVKSSWRMRSAASLGDETALCYVTGKQLPPIKSILTCRIRRGRFHPRTMPFRSSIRGASRRIEALRTSALKRPQKSIARCAGCRSIRVIAVFLQ